MVQSNYEILYMSISSSDIVWELRRQGKNRYKSLTKSQCEAIEHDHQFYLREKSIGKRTQSRRFIQTGTDLLLICQNNHHGPLNFPYQYAKF